MIVFKWRLGFDSAFGVKSVGASGGLVLFWNNDSDVTLKSFSRNHIDVFIKNSLIGLVEWRFTGFYGDATRRSRRRNWELLEYLRREYDNPWLCAGDFNEICSVVITEKSGIWRGFEMRLIIVGW